MQNERAFITWKKGICQLALRTHDKWEKVIPSSLLICLPTLTKLFLNFNTFSPIPCYVHFKAVLSKWLEIIINCKRQLCKTLILISLKLWLAGFYCCTTTMRYRANKNEFVCLWARCLLMSLPAISNHWRRSPASLTNEFANSYATRRPSRKLEADAAAW